MVSKKEIKYQNRLAFEKSPYLLQHADNPVEWYAWGDEAFETAQKENKPIFLSVGYSTCHWCHVMAHESFEDEQVAQLMNDAFVSIKVDREERPDIDGIYMTVCQMMTSGGGWPLTIMMTPEKKPFFAATYIPKETRFGRIGMIDLIPKIQDIWTNRKTEIIESAEKITSTIQQSSTGTPGEELNVHLLNSAYEALAARFDSQYGGFGNAPKFPTPHNLLFLLRYWENTHDEKALHMVEQTLQAMRRGGIYDHVGFGFHRYSTDREWLVPHFEKMLYDQAMLVMAYTEAFQATGNIEYEKTVREVASYILRDMTALEGGFYSAEDADSEGVEGKFYVWTDEEIRTVLGEGEVDFVIDAFSVHRDGNYLEEATQRQNGDNILHFSQPIEEIATRMQLSEEQFVERFESVRQKLFAHREKRIHPQKDDKILTDWNGLMIAALAKAAQAFGEPDYADAAKRATDFILNNMCASDGRLLHRYREGEAALSGYANDYAFLIWGLLELYEATFEIKYLRIALELNQDFIDHFWDETAGGFFASADDGEQLLVRQKEIYDGAIPSGNSVAMLNLLRLGRMIVNPDLEKKAEQIGRGFSEDVGNAPVAYTQLMCALDFAIGPAYEVVIAGLPEAEDMQTMLKALRTQFVPNKVVLLNPTNEGSREIHRLAEFTRDQGSIDGKATAYVCKNYNCQLPTTDPAKILGLLNHCGR